MSVCLSDTYCGRTKDVSIWVLMELELILTELRPFELSRIRRRFFIIKNVFFFVINALVLQFSTYVFHTLQTH